VYRQMAALLNFSQV